jgi:hypothetical protein
MQKGEFKMLRLAVDSNDPNRLVYLFGGAYNPPKLNFRQRVKATIRWFAPFTDDPSKITKGDFIRLYWLLEQIYGSVNNRINIPDRLHPNEPVFRMKDDAQVIPNYLWNGAIDSIEIRGSSTHALDRCGIPEHMRVSYDLPDADVRDKALHDFSYIIKKAIGEQPEHKFLYLCELVFQGALWKPIWILVVKNHYSREARSRFCDAFLWPRWATLRQTAFGILLEAMGSSLFSINIPTQFETGRSKYHEPMPARWPKASGMLRWVLNLFNPT